MSHDDFAFEPVRGLPAALPYGEELLWQGSPDWKSLAVRAYHVRKVAIYFAVIVLWRAALGVRSAESLGAVLLSCSFIMTLGAVAMGVLAGLAYFTSRATVYSITSRRLLLRHGVAVPMTMNVPFKLIEAADFKMHADGTGDISVKVPKDQRVGYLITWPHLRPGYLSQPQPSLRVLRDAQHAAGILSKALAADAGTYPMRIDTSEPVPASGIRPSVPPRSAAVA